MEDWQARTKLLLTEEGANQLSNTKILIVGVGGVGGFAAEFLTRAGCGRIAIADNDRIQPSNRNRQVQALTNNQGESKAEVLGSRLRLINPQLELSIHDTWMDSDTIRQVLDMEKPDYVVDAIDTLTSKTELLVQCVKSQIPVVSSMGSGGKLDPSLVKIADINETNHCRLAYAVRKRLHRQDIYTGITAVYSPEPVDRNRMVHEISHGKASTVGTISYMPPLFAAHITSVIIRSIARE